MNENDNNELSKHENDSNELPNYTLLLWIIAIIQLINALLSLYGY